MFLNVPKGSLIILGKVQGSFRGIFREGAGKVQGRFREGSERVQRGFREGAEKVQRRYRGKFREGSGKVQGSPREGKIQEGFRGWKVQETFFDLFESFKSFD